MRRALPAMVTLALLLQGCSQTARIHTKPTNAKVWIDGEYLGVSPVDYNVRERFVWRRSPHKYRIEAAGHETLEGEIRPTFAVGRAFGALFTVSLLYFFKSPFVIEGEYVFTLVPLEGRNTLTDEETAGALKALNRMYEAGNLTREEYDLERARLQPQDYGLRTQQERNGALKALNRIYEAGHMTREEYDLERKRILSEVP